MTDQLTSRQTQILKALIDEYIETTEPVGSLSLEKKYSLGYSPATIRNEMAVLTKKGFLKQPHTSAGRVPTSIAMKFYINSLMQEKQLSLTEEVRAKEDVWDARRDFDKFMDNATAGLAARTNALAVSTTLDGDTWIRGYSNIFSSPILCDIAVAQSIFSLLDQQKRIQELFFERLTGLTSIEVLFGEELGWESFEPVGVVATRFNVKGTSGAIGVVGPFGLNYPHVIPAVRYFGNLIEEVLNK